MSSKRSKRSRALHVVFGLSSLVLPAWLLTSACGSDSDSSLSLLSEGCTLNSDCNSPLVCAFQRCHAQCQATRDCPKGQRCIQADRPFRVCQLSSEKTCKYNSECPERQVCAVDGQCRDQCKADRDCVPEEVCTQGTCAEPDELVDGRLPTTNPAQKTGQPCTYNSECPEELVCREGLCNYECLADADCAPFHCTEKRRCEYPDGGMYYCFPGQQIECACIGGKGVQVCSPNGLTYLPCSGPNCP